MLSFADKERAGFTAIPPARTGINFINRLDSLEAAANNNLMNGSGVAAGDFDGDGLCDIYFCAIRGTNALYRNLGEWRFENVTVPAGVGLPWKTSTGAVFADIDGDDDLDLLVATLGEGVYCFRNDGHGRFTDITPQAGTRMDTGSTTMALADVNGDGHLDLYVANYGAVSILRSGGRAELKRVGDRWVFTGPYAKRLRFVEGRLEEVGEADVLFLNDGHGRFSQVPWGSEFFLDEEGRPREAPLDFGLTAQMRDINGDLWPDIYVCNDFQTVDRIWINDGRGHFRALPRVAIRKQCFSSMGVDFADIDRDGHLDLCVTEMMAHQHTLRLRQIVGMTPLIPLPGKIENRPEVPRNVLLWNRGDGTYVELANQAGIGATDWTWQPAFLDVDLDGFEDLLIVNGMLHDVQDRDVLARIRSLGQQPPEQARTNLLLYPPFLTPNFAFRNRGDLTFENVSDLWSFNSTNISQGMAFADFDCDGDLDLVINCMNAPALLLRNDSSAPRVAVRLKGMRPNTRGIGATITVRGGPVPRQSQEIIAGGRYLSGDDAMRVFAASSVSNNLTIEIAWRSGRKSVMEHAKPNFIYEFDESVATPAGPVPQKNQVQRNPTNIAANSPAEESSSAPWFKDLTAALGHQHHEVYFNDFARQPLLTRQLSALGPGVAWADLDTDGSGELVIGTGRGGSVEVFRWNGSAGFGRVSPTQTLNWPDDSTGMTIWTDADGKPCVLVGLANYESGLTNGPALIGISLADGRVHAGVYPEPSLCAAGSSPGPLASADVDCNGFLDLFVGMRVTPGAYPMSGGSRLYRQVNGRLVLDNDNTARLDKAGMVSGAAWTDLQSDGYPDLVLACEWGPIRVFLNERGRLTQWSAPVVLSPAGSKDNGNSNRTTRLHLGDLTGWWSSIACGDFDEDGRMDFVAGNWGLNDAAQIEDAQPLRLHYGDLAGHGVIDLVESYYTHELKSHAPRRTLNALSQAFPMLLVHYPTHATFARATVTEILGCLPNRAAVVEANVLDSMLFLNRGDHLLAVPLPGQAQWAPVFGILVADADGDGHDDMFLAQNFFALRPEWPRLDAGRGLWLKGDGSGGFTPVAGTESGVFVYGEQRGAAIADFNADGRIDFVVAQNAASTRVFQNVKARPGLRVRLLGPKGNRFGIGSRLRMGDGRIWGPGRLVGGGSGYWSQNSPVHVMSGPTNSNQLEILWPGGKRMVITVPPETKEISASFEGTFEVKL